MTIPKGILNNESIREAIQTFNLITNIKEDFEDQLQACSFDLTIGTIFRDGKIISIETADKENILVKPGEVISLFTKEELNLPPDILATAFPINRLSSEGLLVLNPGHIDPGFQGALSVRAINVRKTDIHLTLNMEIFTVIFEKLPKESTKPYDSNVKRNVREKNYNQKDIDLNPRSLSNLVFNLTEHPFAHKEWVTGEIKNFVDEDKVKTLIRTDAINRVNLSASLGAAFIGLLAFIVLMAQTFCSPKPEAKQSNQANTTLINEKVIPSNTPEKEVNVSENQKNKNANTH